MQPFTPLLVPTPQDWVHFIAGKVPAGFPSPAEDHLVDRIDLMAKLVAHPQDTFFVRIKGDSMQGAGIFDGTVVMVDKAIKPRHERHHEQLLSCKQPNLSGSTRGVSRI